MTSASDGASSHPVAEQLTGGRKSVPAMHKKIPVGISACLLGQEVRYNGGHKRSSLCLNHLSRVFEFQSFCPEMAIGMGVPREPIRLMGKPESPRAIGTKTRSLDVTDPLYDYGVAIGEHNKNLCGYILMKDSPSCGLVSAKIYDEKGISPGRYAGIFVRALHTAYPLLPLEEEGRLNDLVLRENFVARIFAFHDWKNAIGDLPSPDKLVKFHSRYKYLLMAHSQKSYRELGRMVACAGIDDSRELAQEYIEQFMLVIAGPASRRGHANTLYHLLGYLKKDVSGVIRRELVASIEKYRTGMVNLAVPVALIRRYLKLYGSDYIQSQAYLEPYAHDLGLGSTN